MALSLWALKSTKQLSSELPAISVIYGVDGIGKTSLAAEWPDAVYLPTEGERPPSDIDLPSPGTLRSMDDVWGVVGELLGGEHEFKTVILDSLDGLEGIIWRATCARLGVSSIEEPGFGKGYVEADTEWKEYLDAVGELQRAGMFVVQLAHPEIVRFDSPTTDPYSRYTIKLHKRANALVREQADVVAFMNYRVSIKEKEVGPKKTVAHAEGGKERQIHLVEGPGFVAKNRYSMSDSIRYQKGSGFAEISKFFPQPAANENRPGAGRDAA